MPVSAIVTVEILCLGAPSTYLDLPKVERAANRIQNHFGFRVCDPIEYLGEPGANGEYRVRDLANLMRQTRGTGSQDKCLVGIIDAVLEEAELFSAVDETNSMIVVSTAGNDVRGLLRETRKSYSAYVLTEIAAQLLTIEYRRQTGCSAPPEECAPPWHRDTRTCLFDYCDDPEHTAKKLINPRICDSCKGHLSEANVPRSVVEACQTMLKEGWRSRLGSVALEIVQDPTVAFLFGGLSLSLVSELGEAFRLSNWIVPSILPVPLLLVGWQRWHRRRGSFV